LVLQYKNSNLNEYSYKETDNSPIMKTKLILNLLICLVISGSLFAQTSRDTLQYKIDTKDGNQYVGRIVSEDSIKTVMVTNVGTITIPAGDIQSKSEIQVGQIRNGVLWFNNPQATRYFFAPNGYGLEKGEAYYQNIWLFFNQFVVGVTKNF